MCVYYRESVYDCFVCREKGRRTECVAILFVEIIEKGVAHPFGTPFVFFIVESHGGGGGGRRVVGRGGLGGFGGGGGGFGGGGDRTAG